MKTIMIIAAMLFCFGCASVGNQKIMNSNFMSSLQIGATTKDEVKTLLGEPQLTGIDQYGKDVWRYAGQEKTVNAAAFIPLVDIAAGRQSTVDRTVDLYFEKDGKLYDIQTTSNLNERIAPIGTIGVVLVGAGAAAGAAASRPYGGYGYGYRGYGTPGKAIINTIPTGGGGSMTTIKWYK
jgi:outer membrane protein assembly factor BamE (lipoprotein component of BamABCDE complex)